MTAAAGAAAHPSFPVSPDGDAGVTPRGSPGEWLLEALSKFCSGGFCAGALPEPAGNKTAPKVPSVPGRSRGWTTLCVLRVGLDPLPAPHQAWPGARLAWHFHQSSWDCYCCLFMACARVWIGARGCLQLKDGSKLFPRAALPVQQHVLKSFPNICGFPVFPYPDISLTSLFPSLFLWIHLDEFPAVVLRFSPISAGWTEGGQAGRAGPAAPTSPC